MFKGMSIQEFREYFTCEDKCRTYLYDLKWKGGFSCFRCGGQQSGKGHTAFHLRCTSCNYEESITANTLFHKLKIPLMKAFGLIYRLTIPSRGSSCADLAREYAVNPKTAWAFAQKVRLAMAVEDDTDELNSVELARSVDSIIICGGEKAYTGLQQVQVSLSDKNSTGLLERKFLNAKIRLPEEQSKINCELLFGKFIKQNKDIRLWNFKSWLTGAHHRCSWKYLQGYINEFFFRSGFRNRKYMIWHQVIINIMSIKPTPVLGFVPK